MENTTVSRRQRTKDNNKPNKKMAFRTASPKNKLQKLCRTRIIFYGLLVLCTTCLIIGYQIFSFSHKANILDDIGYAVGLHSNIYAVIIDAGSTGSRILAMSFYKSGFDGGLRMQDDLFVQNKPGLSSYVDNPKQGAKKIIDLLNEVKAFIPESAWPETPIALRATAGLRLLPPDKAKHLLEEVRTVINESPFLSDEHSVSIMDGKDEGLFSWFTVNFLLDHLNDGNMSRSVVTLDLGGGSVQITFIPDSSLRIKRETPDHLYSVSILNKKVNLYSYSYLGLGLMAARRNIFLSENTENSTDIWSSCINQKINNQKWNYGGKTFNVNGQTGNNANEIFGKCYQIARSVVVNSHVDKPPEIFNKEIIAFSYFFDRAAESGLIDSQNGGILSVNDFKEAAEKICNSGNVNKPFMCLDLTFIASLLEHGFGLKSSTMLKLLDTIDGHEISWALGAGYSILEDKLS